MVEGQFFDKLAKLGSMLRKSSKPFGGIQVRRLVDTLLTDLFGQREMQYRPRADPSIPYLPNHRSSSPETSFNFLPLRKAIPIPSLLSKRLLGMRL